MSKDSAMNTWMGQALELARRGLYTTDPNPRVGCVLVKDGRVVGQGFHAQAGGPHAEIVALRDAGDAAAGADCYVTLEPCSHQGRTGPCADALIRAGVARVFSAMQDPNPQVAGSGLARLREAGIPVREGVLEAQAMDLNPGFVLRHQTGRPWMRVKLAQSLDGRTALANGVSQWITGEAARLDGQRWRARASAILSGSGTVLADDPSLTARLSAAAGGPVTRQPLRVIMDSNWRTPAAARTLGLEGQVVIFGADTSPPPAALVDSGAELLAMPRATDGPGLCWTAVMTALAEREINEVHVEAGAVMAGSLLSAGLLDELLLYQAPCILGGDGWPTFHMPSPDTLAQAPRFNLHSVEQIGADQRLLLRPRR